MLKFFKAKSRFVFINEQKSNCTKCGETLEAVDYYSSNSSSSMVSKIGNQETYNISYTNIKPHTGSICKNCLHKHIVFKFLFTVSVLVIPVIILALIILEAITK